MSYNMLDMELDYQEQIEYLESEVKRLKAKCNRLIRENRTLKGDGSCWILFNSGIHKVFLSYKDAKEAQERYNKSHSYLEFLDDTDIEEYHICCNEEDEQ